MKKGFITKTAITPANLPDGNGLKHICPEESVIFANKGYCGKFAQEIIKKKRCVSKAILRNNMIGKDYKRDSKISKVRMPYEHVFSKMSKKARYVGQAKMQFQGFMQAIAHNFKKLLSSSPPFDLSCAG